MSTTFVTSKVFNQFVTTFLANSGALTMQIGGLPSNTDWASVYPGGGQGNNLNIIATSSNTVTVKAGTIWTGSVAVALAADTVLGVGQTITLTSAWPNYVYAINSGGHITIQVVSSTLSPTPPGGTIQLIGVVYVDSAGKIFQIVTIPTMVNQIATVTPSVSLIGWDGLTSAAAAPGGRFSSSNPLNAIQVVGAFNLSGSFNVGEFALTTGAAGMSSIEVPGASTVIAYLAQSAQVAVADALLTLTWNLVCNEPGAFY